MPYSTIPITSGSAKFSTLDPDADLFLEENNITVGANPENPATLYDYSTSTLNISNINGNNGEVNLINSDLIGVKRFVCADYLGAFTTVISDNVRDTIYLNDTSSPAHTYNFRVPSNFIGGSMKLSIFCITTNTATLNLWKHDPETQTDSLLNQQTLSSGLSGYTDISYDFDALGIKAGDLLNFNFNSYVTVKGTEGIKIKCDYVLYSGAVWEVIN